MFQFFHLIIHLQVKLCWDGGGRVASALPRLWTTFTPDLARLGVKWIVPSTSLMLDKAGNMWREHLGGTSSFQVRESLLRLHCLNSVSLALPLGLPVSQN